MGSVTQSVGHWASSLWRHVGGRSTVGGYNSKSNSDILRKPLAPVSSSQSNSTGNQGAASSKVNFIGRSTTMASTSPLSVFSDDVIHLIEAIVAAYTTGSGSFTGDASTFSVGGKTVTITPSLAISIH